MLTINRQLRRLLYVTPSTITTLHTDSTSRPVARDERFEFPANNRSRHLRRVREISSRPSK